MGYVCSLGRPTHLGECRLSATLRSTIIWFIGTFSDGFSVSVRTEPTSCSFSTGILARWTGNFDADMKSTGKAG
jgi:hypothetical protein